MAPNGISVPERKFKDVRIRLSVRLNQIIFPIDGFELIDAFRRGGYILLTSPPPLRPLARGAMLEFRGPIAQKGENIIDGNSDRGFLGVEGPSYESAIRGFNELKELIKGNFGIDFDEGARFYEIIAKFDVDTVKNPLEAVSRVFGDNGLMATIDNILEQETSIFSLRFTPKGRIPNQEEWFDITIEPDLIKPTTTYAILLIYRGADRSKVEKFGEGLESKILRLIDEIERIS